MTPREVTPTDDQLRAAYARLACSPRWPRAFEEALRHPSFGVAIRAVARRMALQPQPQPTPAPAAAAPVPALPPSPATTPSAAARPGRGGFDPKRAAAHDRDD